jgi:hypothetical protein
MSQPGTQRPHRRLTAGMEAGVATVERVTRLAGHTAESVVDAARHLPRDLPDLMKEGQACLRGLSGYVYGLPLDSTPTHRAAPVLPGRASQSGGCIQLKNALVSRRF